MFPIASVKPTLLCKRSSKPQHFYWSLEGMESSLLFAQEEHWQQLVPVLSLQQIQEHTERHKAPAERICLTGGANFSLLARSLSTHYCYTSSFLKQWCHADWQEECCGLSEHPIPVYDPGPSGPVMTGQLEEMTSHGWQTHILVEGGVRMNKTRPVSRFRLETWVTQACYLHFITFHCFFEASLVSSTSSLLYTKT